MSYQCSECFSGSICMVNAIMMNKGIKASINSCPYYYREQGGRQYGKAYEVNITGRRSYDSIRLAADRIKALEEQLSLPAAGEPAKCEICGKSVPVYTIKRCPCCGRLYCEDCSCTDAMSGKEYCIECT